MPPCLPPRRAPGGGPDGVGRCRTVDGLRLIQAAESGRRLNAGGGPALSGRTAVPVFRPSCTRAASRGANSARLEEIEDPDRREIGARQGVNGSGAKAGVSVFPESVGGPDEKWCRGPESNWRHHDFQSCALPTELPRRVRRARRSNGSLERCSRTANIAHEAAPGQGGAVWRGSGDCARLTSCRSRAFGDAGAPSGRSCWSLRSSPRPPRRRTCRSSSTRSTTVSRCCSCRARATRTWRRAGSPRSGRSTSGRASPAWRTSSST